MALEEIAEWIQERYPKPKLDPVSTLQFDVKGLLRSTDFSLRIPFLMSEMLRRTIHACILGTWNMRRIVKEWTQACFDFLQTELQLNPATQLEQLIQHVHLQLLQSNLCDSAIRQTGFPAGLQVQGGMKKGVIGTGASGGAILVQIVGIMEVGNSAFTLGNVRQARLDKADMTGLTRDNEEPGEGADGEGERGQRNGRDDDEEDATMPPYPRSMLSLQLSDGTTTIKAMETKRIGGLVLGETPLGFKLLLKNVPVRNGIAMLEPNNVDILGYQNDELQSQADFNFMNALRKRMGKPEVLAPDEQEQPQPEALIEPPPGPPAPLAPQAQRGPPRLNQSPYFEDSTPPPEELSRIRVSPPLGGAAAQTIPRNTLAKPPPQQPRSTRRPGVIHTSSEPNDSFDVEEDISMDMDEEFWQGIEEVEEKVRGEVGKNTSSGATAPGSTNTRPQARAAQPQPPRSAAPTGGRRGVARPAPADIIELEDSEEEKENVNTRLKRRVPAPSMAVDMIDLSD